MIFGMAQKAQKNVIKFACQLTFKQDLYVYFINIITYLILYFQSSAYFFKA